MKIDADVPETTHIDERRRRYCLGMRRPRRPVVAGPCGEPDRAASVPAAVPNLVGLALPAAHDTALDAGLLGVVVRGEALTTRSVTAPRIR